MAASEEYNPTCICAAKNGKFYEIPITRMFKADITEFGQSITQAPHPFVADLTDKTTHIRKIYAGDVNFHVKRVERTDLQASFDKVYDTSSAKFIES